MTDVGRKTREQGSVIDRDCRTLDNVETWYLLHDADKKELLMSLVVWSNICITLAIQTFHLGIQKEKKKQIFYLKHFVSHEPIHIFHLSIHNKRKKIQCAKVVMIALAIPVYALYCFASIIFRSFTFTVLHFIHFYYFIFFKFFFFFLCHYLHLHFETIFCFNTSTSATAVCLQGLRTACYCFQSPSLLFTTYYYSLGPRALYTLSHRLGCIQRYTIPDFLTSHCFEILFKRENREI